MLYFQGDCLPDYGHTEPIRLSSQNMLRIEPPSYPVHMQQFTDEEWDLILDESQKPLPKIAPKSCPKH